MFLLQENQSIASTFAMSRLQMRVCCGQMRWEGFKWGEHNTREVFRKMQIYNFFYDSGLGVALHLRKCQRKICNGNDLNINGVYLGTFVKKMRTFRFLTEAGAWSKQIGCCWKIVIGKGGQRRQNRLITARFALCWLSRCPLVGSAISNYLSWEKLEKSKMFDLRRIFN